MEEQEDTTNNTQLQQDDSFRKGKTPIRKGVSLAPKSNGKDSVTIIHKSNGKRRMSKMNKKPIRVKETNVLATVDELAKKVNQITNFVVTMNESVSSMRKWIEVEKQKIDITPEAVEVLSARGNTIQNIARLFGVSPNAISTNKELVTAYERGQALINDSLYMRQVETALQEGGKGATTMLIWLGKQRLGQQETPTTQINIQNNSGGDLKQKIIEARAKAKALIPTDQEAIDAFSEVVEEVDGEQEGD